MYTIKFDKVDIDLNKARIIDTLKFLCSEFNVPHNHLHITHGAAAVINGIRETTRDIDVSVLSPITWEEFKGIGLVECKRYELLGLNVGADVLDFGMVELHWPDEFDISQDVNVVDGFLVSTNYQILIERIKLGRDKDLEEAIKLIPEHFASLPKYLQERAAMLGWV